jgi:hypothetical protein
MHILEMITCHDSSFALSIDYIYGVRHLRIVATNGTIAHPPGDMSVDSHGDDDGWGKLLIHPPEISGSPTSRDTWEQVGGMDEGVRILCTSI